MGRKPNNPPSSLATSSSRNNLNRESAKHACLDRKNLTKPPLLAENLRCLHIRSEDKVAIKRRPTDPTLQSADSTLSSIQQHQAPGEETQRALAIDKNKLSVRYKGV